MTVLNFSYKICSCPICALIRCQGVSKTQCDILELFMAIYRSLSIKQKNAKKISQFDQIKLSLNLQFFIKSGQSQPHTKKSALYLVATLEREKNQF